MTVGALVTRWPRCAAVACFGVAGSALPAHVVLPGAAAALAGAPAGSAICDPSKVVTAEGAILRGAG